ITMDILFTIAVSFYNAPINHIVLFTNLNKLFIKFPDLVTNLSQTDREIGYRMGSYVKARRSLR
ncbi:MAG: hypothetical protein LUE22_03920, partial [Oscillospiraceae bacterium]|nr:hypothetical protein [Oscillospiraceae bacterium]